MHRGGEARVLISTDVWARGLDVQQVSSRLALPRIAHACSSVTNAAAMCACRQSWFKHNFFWFECRCIACFHAKHSWADAVT